MTGDRCGAICLGDGERGRWVCERSPAAMYRRCCQHEHVHEGPLCDLHAGSADTAVCIHCLDHPSHPHECGMHVQPMAGRGTP